MTNTDEAYKKWNASLTVKDYGTMDRPGSLSFESAFKAGWDARDEQLLKLHGEGAMADVIRLQQENKRLRETLEFYAAIPDGQFYGPDDIYLDFGHTARIALKINRDEEQK